MPARAEVEAAARPHGLRVAGVAPAEGGPVALLAPDEPAFWPLFAASPEAADGRPDPMDRWSRRVIGRIACDLGTKAAFPFGGPPHRPFFAWALASGEAFGSPVALLVHATRGLWISYRGAVRLSEGAPEPAPRPCDACAAPCLTACPVGALTGAGYDGAACHAFLDTPAGRDCLTGGCRVRRACPVGRDLRDPRQSAFHMRAFHPESGSALA